MSMQALQSFREKVGIDTQLQAAAQACLSGRGGALDFEAVAALGKQHGYDISASDVKAAISGDGVGLLYDELSDLELELVSAGNPINCSDESAGG